MFRSRAQNGLAFWLTKRASCRPRKRARATQLREIYTPPWRPASILDEWVVKETRPISLRQLMVFGRSLTEARLISSANYVRMELPTRLAHRIRDMQTLPYVVVTNPHMSEVYELYYRAFESFRRVREIRTLEDNEKFCSRIRENLDEHLTVIPKLAMGVLECRSLMKPEDMDKFMNTILRSRISRRVIAEQHLALTETFSRGNYTNPLSSTTMDQLPTPTIGEVFLKCNTKAVIERCNATISSLCAASNGPDVALPSINITGHLNATFPYILRHLEYIIGELLRNSIQATVETYKHKNATGLPPPIEVTICEAPLSIIIRVSDRGGGIDPSILPHLWSFSKGLRSIQRLDNLSRIPKMAATLQELRASDPVPSSIFTLSRQSSTTTLHCEHSSSRELTLDSLCSLSSRPPNLRLGMGLPLSRVYAEYWAGSLEVHSLEGYGVDAFLSISKLGNRNEQVITRASIDAV